MNTEEENVNYLRNLVYEVMDDEDYNIFFNLMGKGQFKSMYILSSKYLQRARNEFFASLDKDYCDIQKAKNFHNAYKISQHSLTMMASEITVNLEKS